MSNKTKPFILSSMFIIMSASIFTACGDKVTTREMTLWVGPQMVDCATAAPPGDCYQIKFSPNDMDWSRWSKTGQEIIGFQWEEGYEYKLRLRVTETRPRNSDFIMVVYELIEVISKTPAQ